ncbi:MAG: hypothetical protein K2M87_08670 [Muribaculaceae bacterium]|nr:hypothetical protein [Muribaculaceae bacterium]
MKMKSVAAVAIFVVAALLLCFCVVIQEQLILNTWLPVSVCLFIGIVSTIALWKVWVRLMPGVKIWLCCVYNVFVVTAILLSAFYFTIILSCRESEADPTPALVTRLYREKHYKTRRVSRRVYTRGAPYWVYKADVNLPEKGIDKDVLVKYEKYRIMHKGDTLYLPIRRSVLGIEVIDVSHIDYSHIPKPPKKRHYFGKRNKFNSA